MRRYDDCNEGGIYLAIKNVSAFRSWMNVLFAKISFTLVMGAGHGIENNFKVKLGLEIVRTKIMTFSRLDNSTATRRWSVPSYNVGVLFFTQLCIVTVHRKKESCENWTTLEAYIVA